MRTASSICLSFLLSFPILSEAWIWIDFKIRQEQLTQAFCVNQDQPLLMCSGSCYLTVLLQADEPEQQTPIAPDRTNKIEILYFKDSLARFSLQPSAAGQGHRLFVQPGLPRPSAWLQDIFHPPPVLAV